jgi:hypothetical protein
MKFKKRMSSPSQSTHPRLLTLYAMEANTIHQCEIFNKASGHQRASGHDHALFQAKVLATLECDGGAEPPAAQGMCHGGATRSARVLEDTQGQGTGLLHPELAPNHGLQLPPLCQFGQDV